MFPYISNTPDDEKLMLKNIGMSSIEDLFKDIPDDIKLHENLNLGSPLSEIEVSGHIKQLADKNLNLDELTCFMGAGAYDHYIPAVIKHITSRSEFYTAYTPYQPEISQGTLQAIFEYQTMIADLTGMDVSNASMYDGATTCVEAAVMAVQNTKRPTVLVSKTVNPQTRTVLKTYAAFNRTNIVEIDMNGGETDVEKLKALLDSSTAAVIVQNPNFFGIVEDVQEIEKLTHANKSMLIMSVDPISLGILKTPGETGADIAVGEGQSLGNPLSFGGPYLGFMAASGKLMRKLPGRIVGETTDVDGKRAYVLTLQAREQHIRRQKASSNICSNEALNALSAAIYMTVMGKQGIKEAAVQCLQKSHYAFTELTRSGKYKPVFNKPFFKEFAVKCGSDAAETNNILLENGILGGYLLQDDYSELKNSMLLCVTEKRTRKDIDKLVYIMEGIK